MSKCSSKHTKCSSAALIASLKLLLNLTKAKLFVEQADYQAKIKFDLIRKRKELKEAETLTTQVIVKEAP